MSRAYIAGPWVPARCRLEAVSVPRWGQLFDLLASDVSAALGGINPTEQEIVARFLSEITAHFERRVGTKPLDSASVENTKIP
jgi:hypothetical protein